MGDFPALPHGAFAPIVAKAAKAALLPRIPLPRTPVNKGKKKAEAARSPGPAA